MYEFVKILYHTDNRFRGKKIVLAIFFLFLFNKQQRENYITHATRYAYRKK